MNKVIVPLTAMFCITVLEGIALARGIDGAVLGVSIAALAAIGGYTLRYVTTGSEDDE